MAKIPAPKLPATLVDAVVNTVQDYYFGDNPPPKFVIVDRKSVRQDRQQQNVYYARVTIEVEYVAGSTKSHTVYIRFAANPRGQLIRGSLSHLPT